MLSLTSAGIARRAGGDFQREGSVSCERGTNIPCTGTVCGNVYKRVMNYCKGCWFFYER